MRKIIFLSLIIAMFFVAGKTSAEDVFDRLGAEPVTMLVRN